MPSLSKVGRKQLTWILDVVLGAGQDLQWAGKVCEDELIMQGEQDVDRFLVRHRRGLRCHLEQTVDLIVRWGGVTGV